MTALPSPNGAFDGQVQVVWDSTSLSLALTCPRKYYYSQICQKTPRGTSVHLRFGSLYATALEHYYKHVHNDGLDHEAALLLVVKEAMIETWDDKRKGPEFFDSATKTRSSLIRTIVWYLEQFHDEASLRIVTFSDGRPAVEVSFKLPITTDIMLSGHLDRIVSYIGSQYVMDQKTSGQPISAYYFKSFKPSTQMALYTFAGQTILSMPVKGVIIDGAHIKAAETTFGRGFVQWSHAELEEWLEETIHYIRLMQSYSETGGEHNFPMNPASCGNYGGCPFRDVCSSPPRLRPGLLRDSFDSKVWDPTINR